MGLHLRGEPPPSWPAGFRLDRVPRAVREPVIDQELERLIDVLGVSVPPALVTQLGARQSDRTRPQQSQEEIRQPMASPQAEQLRGAGFAIGPHGERRFLVLEPDDRRRFGQRIQAGQSRP